MSFINRVKAIFKPTIRCRVCGRPLFRPKDRAEGIGAGCAAKERAMWAQRAEEKKAAGTLSTEAPSKEQVAWVRHQVQKTIEMGGGDNDTARTKL